MRFFLPTVIISAIFPVISCALSAPFHTEGRWIVDNAGANFTYIGANWPGAGEAMIPEGLQYQSIAYTINNLKTLGFNAIRLTFPIELVDEIYENNGTDTTIEASLINALGSDNGTKVWDQVRTANPSFTTETTRLQAYDAVAAEAAAQGIYVHLDNHISRAEWCCSTNDGNSWFGDTYFNVDNWKRGLEYMAKHAASWPSFVSIGLRNELRTPDSGASTLEPYTWPVWYENMLSAATRVNSANPDILIFLSGLNFDTTLAPIPNAEDLGDGRSFRLSDFSYADKLVLELHNYASGTTSCSSLRSSLSAAGFEALDDSAVNQMPVTLTEFGFDQTTGAAQGVYAQCLAEYIPNLKAGWFVWSYGGGYYTRQGVQDREDTWGVVKKDWSGLRNETAFGEAVGRMIELSL